jgi:LysM repeat protein
MFPRILIVLAAVALLVGMYARPSGGAGRPHIYVVRPADTLWSIAASHYSGDPREAVWRLERRNGLAGTTLVPGQRVVLP